MGEQKNIIVINGKSYDASTGDLISSKAAVQITVNDSVSPQTTPQPSQQHHKSNRSSHHLAHHKPQKSITLKRTQPKKTQHIASAKSLPLSTKGTVTVKSGGSHLHTTKRLERAKQINKSNSISRFNLTSSVPGVTKQHQPLEVQPAPSTPAFHTSVPKVHHASKSSGEDLFNAALSKADSHKQVHHKVSRRKHRIAKKLGISARAGNIVTAILVIAVLGSFIAYQNASNLSMRVAASKSGLSTAALPNYKPAGFSLNRHIGSEPGQVTLNYQSNSDDRSFTVTQASSSWSSQTLADSFLNDKQAERVVQSDGKVVYLYNGSDATWVEGGVWYRVEGNSSLTPDQLLQLANSF